jgi:hypothetical protein
MKLGRGYDIRIQRTGEALHKDVRHAYGINGELPPEWEEIQEDETVEHAEIFPSTQRNRSAGKRKLAGEYSRESEEDEAS